MDEERMRSTRREGLRASERSTCANWTKLAVPASGKILVRPGVLAVLFILFIIRNSKPVSQSGGVDFIFVTADARLIWVFLVCALIGGLVGYLLGRPSEDPASDHPRRPGRVGGRPRRPEPGPPRGVSRPPEAMEAPRDQERDLGYVARPPRPRPGPREAPSPTLARSRGGRASPPKPAGCSRSWSA